MLFCVFRGFCVDRRDAPSDERRGAVAERQDPPRRGGDVETRRERQRQQQDREGIQQDAERKAARLVLGPIETPAAEPRQQEGVEHERERGQRRGLPSVEHAQQQREQARSDVDPDRKSTRLNSSHITISYAVFCLKKKKKKNK